MNLNDIPPEVAKNAPGAVGSLIAMRWIKDSGRARRMAMFAAGWATSSFLSAELARKLSMSEGTTGFLIGLFGMAIISKVFETWSQLELGSLIKDALRKLLGLSKED